MYYVIIAAIIGADQAVKYLIRANMEPNESFPVIGNILHITHISNSGAAFSLLQGQTAILIIIPAAFIAAILIYILRSQKSGQPLLLTALSLICGGGAGNLIDRVRLGAVVDFIDFRVFPVFNVADICVCCGCGLLFISMFFIGGKSVVKREDEQGRSI